MIMLITIINNLLYSANIEIGLLIIFLAWHYSLFCGYVSDDHSAIVQDQVKVPETEKLPTDPKTLKPVPKEPYHIKVFNDGIIMYFWNRLFWKLGFRDKPFFWHLTILLLHLANCFLFYKFLTSFFGFQVAVYSAILWGVNPMLNQNVVWISGRPYTTAVFLTLLALLNYNNIVAFMGFFGFAVITNITTAMFPFLLKMIYPNAWQSNVYILFVLFVGFPFILWKFHRRFEHSLVIDRENFQVRARRIFTLIKIYGYYTILFICPVRMGWYHQAGFRYNKDWEKFNFLTLLAGFSTIFIIKQGWIGWWFIFGLLPNSNVYATNSFVADRYMYFASMGLAVILAKFLVPYPILIWCLVTFYATKSYSYSRHLKDDESLYKENWRNHPKSDYAVNNLSFFLINQKKWEEARAVILKGLDINRNNKMLWYNLGVTWAGQGHFQNDEGKFSFLKALDCWKMALQIEPRWAKPAEDMQKLVKILVEQKVLTLDKGQAISGVSMDLPVSEKAVNG